jgi:hypothetical protein
MDLNKMVMMDLNEVMICSARSITAIVHNHPKENLYGLPSNSSYRLNTDSLDYMINYYKQPRPDEINLGSYSHV